MHWGSVLIGVVASLTWYVLIGTASWSATSFVVSMVIGMALAGLATWILAWKGDPGLGIGIGMMIGVTLSFLVFLGGCYAFLDSVKPS